MLKAMLIHTEHCHTSLSRLNTNTYQQLRFCSKLAAFSDKILLIQILSTCYNISLILMKLVSVSRHSNQPLIIKLQALSNLQSDRDKYKYLTILGVFICQLYLVQWTLDILHDDVSGGLPLIHANK